MKINVVVLATFAAGAAAKTYTVLTFGDSWGDVGPTWRVIKDAFKKNGVDAEVKSAAIGGTTACQWAVDGNSMVQAAKAQFPGLTDGPDFVWYTAGGNDNIDSDTFGSCTKNAKSIEEAEKCTDTQTNKVKVCTSKIFDNYWKAFPKSKIMECNYDVPCENGSCLGMDAGYLGAYCGGNITCLNTMAVHWVSDYIGALQKKYPQPQYTAVHIEGIGQMVEGDVKASIGVPDLDRSGVCDRMLACVHPMYGSKYATAIGDAFWNLFFSKYTKGDDAKAPGKTCKTTENPTCKGTPFTDQKSCWYGGCSKCHDDTSYDCDVCCSGCTRTAKGAINYCDKSSDVVV